MNRRARAALLTAGSMAVALLVAPGCGEDRPSGILLPARRGDLEEVLRLSGSLQPVKEQSIRSPRWGEIRRLAANGSTVKAGEIVLELDSEDVENAIRDHEADVEVAATELRQVQTEVEKARRRADLRLEAAKLTRQLQESRLKELKARPTERELTDATSRLALAKALVEASVDSAALVRDLVASGYAPGEDLRSAQMELAQARADLAAAEARLRTTREGPTASERQEAEIQIQQASLAEQSADKNIEIVKEWSDAKLARFTRRLEREKEKLDEARRRLGEYQAKAPNDGIVLHAKARWGGDWQPGRHVWQGATVMSIPELSRMKLIIQVPASSVRQLESLGNVAARVRARAVPDKVFSAKLTRISAIGRDEFEQLDSSTSEKVGRAERQVFEAEVEISEEDPRLMPGFNAEAELILRRVTDAIILPRMTLVHSRQQSTARGSRRGGRGGNGGRPASMTRTASVYVLNRSGGYDVRTVEVIAANRLEAAVKGPVRDGDLLYPGRPPGAAPPVPVEPAPAPASERESGNVRPPAAEDGADQE